VDRRKREANWKEVEGGGGRWKREAKKKWKEVEGGGEESTLEFISLATTLMISKSSNLRFGESAVFPRKGSAFL